MIFLTFFSLLLAVIIAIGLAANMLYGQYVWIERGPTTPGGPIAYFAENTAWWVNTLGSSAGATASFIADAYFLYRCYIILGSPSIWVMILPTLIYLASTVLAIMTIIEGARPNSFILSGHAANFGVPWISLTVAFNVIVTIMISWRLVSAHYEMNGTLPEEYVATYTGVTAIVVESALPLAISGIIFVVLYSKNHPTTSIWAGIWGVLVGISPQLITLRVAMGIAWSQNTLANGTKSKIAFAQADHSTTFTGHAPGTYFYDISNSENSASQQEKVGDGPVIPQEHDNV
ncbi:hypothetical protein CPC08DRAFT_710364 [Agrocybe pediades]|nr:hypothetical protein CPC08DRAFT_710364 [Agrocybe pediades]